MEGTVPELLGAFIEKIGGIQKAITQVRPSFLQATIDDETQDIASPTSGCYESNRSSLALIYKIHISYTLGGLSLSFADGEGHGGGGVGSGGAGKEGENGKLHGR